VRFSHLLIVQVLFIFVAVALILFNDTNEVEYSPDKTGTGFKLQQACLVAIDAYDADTGWPADSALAVVQGALSELPGLNHAALVLPSSDDSTAILTVFSRDNQDSATGGLEYPAVDYYDPSMIRLVSGEEPGFTLSSIYGSKHTVFYGRLGGPPDVGPWVLAAILDHDLLVSEAAPLKYAIFVLFLFSALVSLLTVYLLIRHFQSPLERLTSGMEKTAEGELFHIVEADGDAELGRLTRAFNQMSRRLWTTHRTLKDSNVRLAGANAALQESKSFFTELINKSPLAIVVADADGEIILINEAAGDMFGYSDADAVGRPIDSLFIDEAGIGDRDIADVCDPQAEVICRRRDGSHFPAFAVTGKARNDLTGREACLYMVRDITESRNFQDMMIRLDRYYTRGQMAGDIAHEINNYLAVLLGNVELMPLLLKKGKMEKVDQKLELMKDTVERIVQFTDGLMDTPRNIPELEATSLNQIVENVLAFLKPQNKFDKIDISVELSTEMPVLELDPGQIQQLLVNLIYNAADAANDSDGPKTVRVATSVVTCEGVRYARVDVCDSGPGVPEDRVEALFSGRFTTKRKGHGIGLITCRKLVDNHGGQIGYRRDSETVFYFQLPLSGVADVPSVLPEAKLTEAGLSV